MVTARLKILDYEKHRETLKELERQSTACTVKILANLDLMKDKTFLTELSARNPLIGSRMLQAACNRAVEMHKSHKAKQAIAVGRWHELQEELEKSESPRDTYKMNRKIQKLQRDTERGIVIGGRKKLQMLGHLSNEYRAGGCTAEELEAARSDYKSSRNLGWVNEGETRQKGNRHLDLNGIAEGKLVLKLSARQHLNLQVQLPKGRKLKQLLKACRMGTDCKLSLKSVLKDGILYLSYDNQAVEGYAFNTKNWSENLSKIDRAEKEARTACTRGWHMEQKSRMLADKLPNRVLSLDLNPERIGYAVMEMAAEGYRTITHGCLEYRGLVESTKSGKTSSEAKKHNLSLMVKRLFSLASHYRCGRLALEDLDFKHEVFNRRSKRFNRLTKNLWDRAYIERLMTRWCEDLGIVNETIPPQYSSFVGNILFPHYDPTAAACEIGRRCLSWLWIREHGKENLPSPLTWMPTLSKENLPDSLKDVPESALSSVAKAYRWVSIAGLRYRTSKRSAFGCRLTHRKRLWEGSSCYA